MVIPIKIILSIIAAVIQMIADGMSESAAVGFAAAKFGVSESLIRKYL
jgi:peptide deformylase